MGEERERERERETRKINIRTTGDVSIIYNVDVVWIRQNGDPVLQKHRYSVFAACAVFMERVVRRYVSLVHVYVCPASPVKTSLLDNCILPVSICS